MSSVKKRLARRVAWHRARHGFWVTLLTRLGIDPLVDDKETGCMKCRYCGTRFSPEETAALARNLAKFME